MDGWIKLHRRIVEWEWYTDTIVKVVFFHLLIGANHKDNKYRGIDVKKGQILTGRLKLAQELNLSEMQIRTALKKLKSTNEITIKTTSKYSIITINNWNYYQQDNQQDNIQTTNKQPTNNQQITTNNNDKNDNNEKNIISFTEKTEKKLDPFINPIKTFFQEEYSKIMGKTPRLSLFECNRLVELAAENPDIKEVIPLAIKKLKKLNFGKDIKFTPSANWLLKDNNFERILNGEFDRREDYYKQANEIQYQPFVLSDEERAEAEEGRKKYMEMFKNKTIGRKIPQ